MIDIHSHLLPGIDDGPRNWDDALDLCRSVVGDGIRTSVATPHLIDGVYDNVRAVVEPLTAELNQRLRDAGIELTVLSGAEVDFSSRHAGEDGDELPCLGTGNAVLLEMPVAVIPPAISQTIFAVLSRGGVPVIAHPERNEILQRNPSAAAKWVREGALLQLDGDSLLGVWRQRTQRCAETLLSAGLAHAMASDAHSTRRRPPRLSKALQRARELIGDSAAKLVGEGPRCILDSRPLVHPLLDIRAGTDDGSTQAIERPRGRLRRLFGRRVV